MTRLPNTPGALRRPARRDAAGREAAERLQWGRGRRAGRATEDPTAQLPVLRPLLHVFQKKSKHGIATPQKEIELIRARLRWAEHLYTGRTEEG